MPFLNDREVENMAREYGFIDADEEFKVGEKENSDVQKIASDSEGTLQGHEGRDFMQEHEAQDGGFRND